MRKPKRWLSMLLMTGMLMQSASPVSAAFISGDNTQVLASVSQNKASASNGDKQGNSQVGGGVSGTESNAEKPQNAPVAFSNGFTFKQEELTLCLGDPTIGIGVVGFNGSVENYISSNPDVVKVDYKKGMMTAQSSGEAIITATDSIGQTATLKVTVPERKLSFSSSTLRVPLGQTVESVLVKEGFSDRTREFVYTIGDTSVATVSKDGEVESSKLGKTKLYVETNDKFKKVKAECEVEVYTDITLSDLKVKSNFSKEITLSWNMKNTQYFSVYRSENGGEYKLLHQYGYNTDAVPTYVDNTVLSGVSYKYKVIARTNNNIEVPTAVQEVSVTSSNKAVDFNTPRLLVKQKVQIEPTYTGYTNVPKATWSVEDATIASVDKNTGVVTGLKAGKTKITLVLEDGNSVTRNVYVSDVTEVSNLRVVMNFDQHVELAWDSAYGKETHMISRREGNGEWKKLADTTEATFVDTTAQAGHTYEYYIKRVIVRDGVSYETAGVTILVPVGKETVVLTQDVVQLEKGASAQVPIEISGFAEAPKLEYTSSKPDVFSVSESGLVTAKEEGLAEISIQIPNGPTLVCTYFCVVRPVGMYTSNEWRVFTLTNQNRMDEGHDPLSMFPQMQGVADIREHELVQKYDHSRPNGESFWTAFGEVGLVWGYGVAENIAEGFRTPASVVDAWMNSERHYKNIMGDYTHFATGEEQKHWVQLFLKCENESKVIVMLPPRGNRTFAQGTTVEEFGEVLAVYCESHGFSYMPLISQMCTGYDEDAIGKQTITVNYKDLTTTFDVTIKKSSSGGSSGGSGGGGGGGSSSGGSGGGGGGGSSSGGSSSSGGGPSGGSSSSLGGNGPTGGNAGTPNTGNGNASTQTPNIPDTHPGANWSMQEGKWYLVKSDGSKATGWVAKNNHWYYMNPTQEMKTGWLAVDNKWYFLVPSGEMKTGWLNDNNKWYYLNPSGDMKVGWIQDNGKWYYTDASGAMLTNAMTPDGYWVNASGVWEQR